MSGTEPAVTVPAQRGPRVSHVHAPVHAAQRPVKSPVVQRTAHVGGTLRARAVDAQRREGVVEELSDATDAV